ncbi:Tyrosinase [Lasiodiplodia theobromae]|uniref:Tyrosinase n=1 Tax=Lasiodiplodia theobromae TaxID=45133 RepID=UPI0015C39C74|nr:Tyrosinase [Lasiodiplodia theobromae]KAF4542612.1 Tyrosinase [Lasiodiplodia theobromae]
MAEPLPTAAAPDAAQQLHALAQHAIDETLAALDNGGASWSKRGGGACTRDNISIRKEWGRLGRAERKQYIAAVQCLQKLPARTPPSLVPGAKSRFDDFVATHINQTLTIHYTGTFLAWHRWFTWEYEQALRNECGYTGAQPYWDWAVTAAANNTLETSPLFDGSDTSLSGNGAFVPNQGNVVLGATTGLPPIYLAAGTGGGCVTAGPFADMVVNLGPVALDLTNGTSVGTGPVTPDQFAWNPRCLKRDLSDAVNRRYANASGVAALILGSEDVERFQMTMQGVPGSGSIGVHGGGHYSIGGDPGRDLFVSPGDPAFYAHHSQIDRVWTLWQWLDLESRQNALAGTGTFLDSPPSPNTTLDTLLDLGYAAGEPTRVGDLMSNIGGKFCYLYA